LADDSTVLDKAPPFSALQCAPAERHTDTQIGARTRTHARTHARMHNTHTHLEDKISLENWLKYDFNSLDF
jgi:hypothetical protein